MSVESFDPTMSEDDFAKIKNAKTKKQLIEELFVVYKSFKELECLYKRTVGAKSDSLAQTDDVTQIVPSLISFTTETNNCDRSSDINNSPELPIQVNALRQTHDLVQEVNGGPSNCDRSSDVDNSHKLPMQAKPSIDERFDALELLVRNMLEEFKSICPSKVSSNPPSSAQANDKVLIPCDCKSVCECNLSSNLPTPKKVIILSDSQGREMAGRIKTKLKGKADVVSFIRPGCKLDMVVHGVEDMVKKEKLGDEDHLIILGGSADVGAGTTAKDFNATLNKMTSVTRKTNVIIASVPPRYDLPVKFLDTVKTYNSVFKSFVKRSSAQFCELDKLDAKCFTKHGLHYSNLGKNFVAKKLSELILSKPFFDQSPTTDKPNSDFLLQI